MSSKPRKTALLLQFGLIICLASASFWIFTIQRKATGGINQDSSQFSTSSTRTQPQRATLNDNIVHDSTVSPVQFKSPLNEATKSLSIAQDQLRFIVAHFSGQERTSKMVGVVSQAISIISLEDARELIAELPTGEVYDAGSAALGKRFAVLDPVAGSKWLESLPKTKEGTHATMAYFNSLTLSNPELSVQLLHELNPVRQGEALRSVLSQLTARDPGPLLTALNEQSFRELCARYQMRPQNFIINSLINSNDFARAANLANENDYGPKDMTNVISRWTNSNPEEAASWLAANSGTLNEDRYVAAEKLTGVWAGMDALAGSAWLRNLPPGELKDHGIKGLAESVASKDGRGAADWVETIENPALRIGAAEAVVARWATYDEASARDWLNHIKVEASSGGFITQ